MRVWRLQRSIYPALDGEGARLFGGRWNLPGRPVVYTSESLALSTLELLVHLDIDLLPDDLSAYEIDVPDELRGESIEEVHLPTNWRENASCHRCRMLGEAWLDRAESAVLKIPSAVLIDGDNILLNPLHVDAKSIRVVRQDSFRLDSRLLM